MQGEVTEHGSTALDAAFQPSWVDRLLRLRHGAPGLGWRSYGGAFLVLGGITILGRLIIVPSSIDANSVATIVFNASYPLVFLAFLQLLDGVALRALQTVRPALDLDDASVRNLAIDLVRTPGRPATVALLAGSAIGVTSLLSNPVGYGVDASTPIALWVEAGVFGILSTVSALVFLAHAIHQLRLVRDVHRDHVVVDLFRLQPLYAFANLTSWTGIALIALTVYGLGSIQLLAGPERFALGAVDVLTVGAIGVVAGASFVVPLLGLHRRIAEAKDLALARANLSLQHAIEAVHGGVAEGVGLADANAGISAATAAVAAVGRISTWPWRPETLRGFLSALGLPVLVWLITAVLGRFLAR